MNTTRVPIPDHPAYLVVVADNGAEWARLPVTLTYRLNPETRDMSVGADFETFSIKPPLKRKERRTFRIEYRDMADSLLYAGDWSALWNPVGRKDTVTIYPDGA